MLTDRQLEILSLCASGLSQQEVGNELYIGSEAVRKQIAASRRKLNARNTPHLVALAVEQGLLKRKLGTQTFSPA